MDPLWLGGFCLNTEKLVDGVELHLVVEPLMEGVCVLEGLCHVCRLQQGLGACLCLWPIRNGRKRKPLAEHFFPMQAPSFAASENAECDAVFSWLVAEGFTGHPLNSGHQRATVLWDQAARKHILLVWERLYSLCYFPKQSMSIYNANNFSLSTLFFLQKFGIIDWFMPELKPCCI